MVVVGAFTSEHLRHRPEFHPVEQGFPIQIVEHGSLFRYRSIPVSRTLAFSFGKASICARLGSGNRSPLESP